MHVHPVHDGLVRPQAPSLAIVAPVRAEAPYLLEWIAYHRVLGIRAFILADNGGDDGTSDLLKSLAANGIVVRLDWTGARYFQLHFYRQALDLAQGLVDALVFIDVDEFVCPTGGEASIAGIARRLLLDPSVGAVALNWAIFGSSGRVIPGEGLVVERFTKRAPRDFAVNRHAKTLVRTKCCAGPAHNPQAVVLHWGRYINTRGADVLWDATSGPPIGLTTEVLWDQLRVNHYVLKSREEFNRKRRRGSATSALIESQRDQASYFISHNRNDVDDPPPPWLVERTKQEMERLAGVD